MLCLHVCLCTPYNPGVCGGKNGMRPTRVTLDHHELVCISGVQVDETPVLLVCGFSFHF